MKPPFTLDRRGFVKLGALAASAAILPDPADAIEMVSLRSEMAKGPITLPPLAYALDALEPHIDAETMRIHHDIHHAEYIANYNAAFASLPDGVKFEIWYILTGLSRIEDEAIRNSLRSNGGGHWNHDFFWKTLAPAEKAGKPSDHFAKGIAASFGSMDDFKQAFTEAALKCFGSGWVWLILKGDNTLKITTTANQDNPYMYDVVPSSDLGRPILALDIWEHAYYLQYQNRRVGYISSWWNVVNWEKVSKHYDSEIYLR